MVHMKPPRLPEAPPPVLRDADLRAILAACERDKTYAGGRDEAILRVLMDTGTRRAEVLGLRLEDVDLDTGMSASPARAAGPGWWWSERRRSAPSTATFARARSGPTRPRLALARAQGPAPRDWAGPAHPRAGQEAGVAGRLTPHTFRHYYAHTMLAAGMQETDLMAVAGWRVPRHAHPLRRVYAGGARAEDSPGPVADGPARRGAEAMSDAERNLGLLTAVMKLLHGWRAEGDAATADDLAWLASLRGVEIPDEVLLAVLWDRVRLYDVKMHEAFEVIAEARRSYRGVGGQTPGRNSRGHPQATGEIPAMDRPGRRAEGSGALHSSDLDLGLSDERTGQRTRVWSGDG